MSFKYFRPTVRKVTTTQKAPAFKNTASAERFADLLDASDILTNNSVEKHLAEVNLDDHGHSILKESGLTRGHSIIETSFGDQLAGRDSILGGFGKHIEPRFSEDGLRSAVGFAKGMAGKEGSDSDAGMTFTKEEVDAFEAGYEAGKEDAGVDAYTEGYQDGRARGGSSGGPEESDQSTATEDQVTSVDETNSQQDGMNQLYANTLCALSLLGAGMTGPGGPALAFKILAVCTAYNAGKTLKVFRPGPDDNGGSEGGFMTWKLQDQLSNGLQNAKDPITNPYNENQGGGVLTATELKEMEADLRNAKDPATNWGDDTYNNFMGAIEMNVGEISLKAPATNWGDNYTSTTANVVDTVFAVQDVF